MAMVKYAFRTLFELERIKTEEDLNFEMRVGLHTGPCIGGVIGRLKPRYLCWGRTPLISNELEAAGTPGKLLVSSATFAQLNKQVLLTRGLKFRPGEPLHVKTFDNLADEEVPTFFIEMDSITAFTILANEIAEDRAAARRGSSAQMFDDGELTGTGEDGSLKKTLLGVTRLKRLFHGKSSEGSTADPGMSEDAAGVGRTNNPRRPNHLSATGVVMSTQSAYLASPPGSPESKQVQTFDNNNASFVSGWGSGGLEGIPKGWSRGPQAGGQGGGGGAGGAAAGGGGATSAAGRGAPPSRLRRASSAGVEGRKEQQRRRSSLAVIPTSLKNSLQAGGGAAVAAATAVASKATGRSSSTVAVSSDGDGRNGSFDSLAGVGRRQSGGGVCAGTTWGWDGESSDSAGSDGGGGGSVKELSNRRRSNRRSPGGNGGDGSTERLGTGRRSAGDGGGEGWEDGGDELEGRAPAGAAAASDKRSSTSKRERTKRSNGGSGARKSGEEGDGGGGSGGSSSGEDGKAPTRGRGRGEGGRGSLYVDDNEGSGGDGHGNSFLDDDDDAKAGRRRRSRRTSGEGQETSSSSSQGTRADPTAAARAHVLFSGNESDSDLDLKQGASWGQDSDDGGDSSRWNDD
ncbi:unnamed protein product [Ectocarpus sp. 6 AP-2014]